MSSLRTPGAGRAAASFPSLTPPHIRPSAEEGPASPAGACTTTTPRCPGLHIQGFSHYSPPRDLPEPGPICLPPARCEGDPPPFWLVTVQSGHCFSSPPPPAPE